MKFIRFITKHFKKTLLALGIFVASIGVASAVSAWWPERPTFTIQNPAPYVTFNSITNNPNYGDERTFFDAKDAANTSKGGFVDKVHVKEGETILLRAYVHNNAADNLNKPNFTGPGVAHNTKVRIYLPTATAKKLRSNSYVSASNANPKEVADTVDFVSDVPFGLEYIPGSAVAYNNSHPSGMALSDKIVTTGAPLGYTKPDGNVPGCFQYINIVTIRVRVRSANYNVTKQVAIPGQPWAKSIVAQPGQTISYLIGFNNTGSSKVNNVAIRDRLPSHMTIVPGTTTIVNATNPGGVNAGTDNVVNNGINIGNYFPAANAYVKFKARIDDADKLECGDNRLTNTALAYTPNGPVVRDTAEVVVNKPCDNVPVYRCDLLQAELIGTRKFRFTVNYTMQNATFKMAKYTFGDNTAPLITDQTTVEHTYATDGTYSAKVDLTFTVNGVDYTVSSEGCETQINTTSSPIPTGIPNTGPGDMLAVFMVTSFASTLIYRFVLARRLS